MLASGALLPAPGSRPAGFCGASGVQPGGCARTEGDPDDKDSKKANGGEIHDTIEQPTEARQGRSEEQPRCSGPTRHEAIGCNRNAALPRWHDHRCAHKNHRLAVAFGTGLSCRGRAQTPQARFGIGPCRGRVYRIAAEQGARPAETNSDGRKS